MDIATEVKTLAAAITRPYLFSDPRILDGIRHEERRNRKPRRDDYRNRRDWSRMTAADLADADFGGAR